MQPSAKFRPFVFMSLIIILVFGIGLFLAAGRTVVSAQSSLERWISFDGEGEKTAPEVDLLQADENTLTLQAKASGIGVGQITIAGQTYISLGGEGYVQGGEIGAPALPVVFAEVEVPAGAEVSLEVLGLTSQSTSLQAQGLSGLIAPRQPSQPKCGQALADVPPDSQIYAQTSPYPAESVRILMKNLPAFKKHFEPKEPVQDPVGGFLLKKKNDN